MAGDLKTDTPFNLSLFISIEAKDKYLKVNCQSNTSIKELKQIIQEQGKEAGGVCEAKDQTLIYFQQFLEDGKKIQEYNIKNEDIIFLYNSTDEKNKEKIRARRVNNQSHDDEDNAAYILPKKTMSIDEIAQTLKIRAKESKSNVYETVVLGTHNYATTSIVVSADSKFVVSACKGKSIKVFDIYAEQQIRHFQDVHNGQINCVAVSSDNKYIVSSSDDKSIKVINMDTGATVYHFQNIHNDNIRSVVISDDGRYIVSGSFDKSIKVFDMHSATELHHFKEVHTEAVRTVAISPDSRFIASGSADNSIKLFDMHTKLQVHHFQFAHANWINSVMFSADNKYLVSAAADKAIKIYDLQTKQLVHHFQDCHSDFILTAAISANGRFVASGSQDKSIKVYDLHTRQQVHHLRDVHAGWVWCVKFSPDGRFIFSSSEDKSVKMYDLHTKQEIHHFTNAHTNSITQAVISADDKLIVSAGRDKAIKVFDVETKQVVHHFADAHANWIWTVGISTDSRFIVSGSADKTVKIFDLQTKQQVHHFADAHTAAIRAVAISPDGKFAFSGSDDKSIKIYNIHTKETVHHFQDAHTDWIWSLQVSADNKLLLSASKDKSMKLFDIHAKKEVYHFKDVHADCIRSAKLSLDGKFLVSGSDDRSIKVFDMHTKQQLHHFPAAHPDWVKAVAISADNRFIISASDDRSIKMYDVHNGQQIYHMQGAQSDFINTIAISANNKFLVSGSTDKSLKVLPIMASTPIIDFYNQDAVGPDRLYKVLSIFEDQDPKTYRPTALENLFVNPYFFNFLHLSALLAPSQLKNHYLSYSHFKVRFMLDKFYNTPLHYLLTKQPVDYMLVNILFEYIVDYLEDTKHRSPLEIVYIMKSLTPLMSVILSRINPSLRDRYLHLCCQKPYSVDPLEQFGDPQFRYTLHTLPVVTSKVKARIHKEGQDKVLFRTTMLYLDYKPTSNDMLKLAQRLSTLDNEEAFQTLFVEKMIEYLWEKTLPVTLICGLIYSAYMLLFSIYIGLGQSILGYEIFLICMTCLLLAAEGIQMHLQREKYFEDVWNYADLLQGLLTATFMALRISRTCSGVTDESNRTLAEQWISSLAILGGYARWVSYLRIFKATRNLIQTILSILRDMSAFVIILIFIIVGFGLIFLEFQRDNDYGVQLYTTYQLMYGPSGNEIPSVSQQLFQSLILFLLNVVLMNLLISIMGETYGTVQEQRVLTNALTRLDIILESMVYMRLFRRGKGTKGHLTFCEHDTGRLNDHGERNSDWDKGTKAIRKALKANDERTEEISFKVKSMHQQMNMMQQDMQKQMDSIQHEVEKQRGSIQQIKDQFAKSHTELLDAIKSQAK